MTLLFKIFPDVSWEYWERVMKVMLMIFLTLVMMQTKERIVALVWVCVLSLGFFGIKGGLYTLSGRAGLVLGPEMSVHGHRNAIGLAFVMVIPLMYWMLLQTRQKWIRLGLMGAMGLTAMATLGLRGAFLALAAAGAFLILKSRHKILLPLILLVVVPVALHLMPQQWDTRMETIETYQEDGSAMGRLSAWYMAWNLALDRPLVGGGFNCFKPETFARYADPVRFGLPPEVWHDAHSVWFRVLGEHGFVGLGLYILFWIVSWRLASRIIRAAKDREDLRWARDLAAMIQVSIIGFLVGGTFLNLQYWDFPYVLVCMLVCTKAVIDREKARAAGKLGPQGTAVGPPGPIGAKPQRTG